MLYPTIIGGSAGSFKVLLELTSGLPETFPFPLIICVHRFKSSDESFIQTLRQRSLAKIKETEDGESMENGWMYIAPADYHLSFRDKNHFALSKEPPLNYSRPSIDFTLQAAAKVFGSNLMAVLITGGNSDGAMGMKAVFDTGGITIIQDPADAEIPVMPASALEQIRPGYIMSAKEIINFIKKLAGVTK